MAASTQAMATGLLGMGTDILLLIIGAFVEGTVEEVPMETTQAWFFDRRYQSRLTTLRLVSKHLRSVFNDWWHSDPDSLFWKHTARRTVYGILVGRCTVTARDLVFPRLGRPPSRQEVKYLVAIGGDNEFVYEGELEPADLTVDGACSQFCIRNMNAYLDMEGVTLITLFVQVGDMVVAVACANGHTGDEEDMPLGDIDFPIHPEGLPIQDMTATAAVKTASERRLMYWDQVYLMDPNVGNAAADIDECLSLQTVALGRTNGEWHATRNEDDKNLRFVGLKFMFSAAGLGVMNFLKGELLTQWMMQYLPP